MCTGTCFGAFLEFNQSLAEGSQVGVRGSATGLRPNGSEEGSSLRSGELAADRFDLGGEQMNVHERQEAGQRLLEGDQGLVGVAGAGVNGLQRSGHEFWQVVGQARDVLGQLP